MSLKGVLWVTNNLKAANALLSCTFFLLCQRQLHHSHWNWKHFPVVFIFLVFFLQIARVLLFMDCWEEGVSDLETCFKMFSSLWTHIFFFPPPHLPFCFAAIDLLYGGIYCFMCQDYIYDKDMEQIAKEEQRKAWKLQGLVFLPEFLVSVFNHTCPSHLSMAKKTVRGRKSFWEILAQALGERCLALPFQELDC